MNTSGNSGNQNENSPVAINNDYDTPINDDKNHDASNSKKRKYQSDINEDDPSDLDDDSVTSSGSSNLGLRANDNQVILFSIRKEISEDGGDYFVVNMASSDIRPSTSSSVKGQGDHVTAYRCFLEVLINIFNEEEVKNSIDCIFKTFKSLYPNKADDFEVFYQQQKQNPQILSLPSHSDRKEIDENIDLLNDLKEEITGPNAEQIKAKITLLFEKHKHYIHDGVKGNKQYQFADVLEKIATHFLEVINDDAETAFTRENRQKKNNKIDTGTSENNQETKNGSEGSNVRSAVNRLKFISDAFIITKNDESNSITSDQNEEKKSNQEIGNESETARLLEQEKMLDKFYEFYLKPKARYNYGCYNGIDGLFSGCTICSILEIDEGKPRSNNVYLTIDENDEIKYRTAFTPGSNYILLNNLSLENKRSLSTAIKDQNLMSVSQDCKEEVIDVVCRAGHVLNGVLTNIRKTLVADKRQSILDLVKFFSPCEENKVLDILVRDIGSLFDFPYNQTRASDPNIENKLPKLVARHLLFMFHAFPGLRILSEDDKEKMIKNFLDKTVLADNKWNCYPSYGVETLYTALKPFIKMEDYTLCDPTDMLRANLTGSSPTAFAISMG